MFAVTGLVPLLLAVAGEGDDLTFTQRLLIGCIGLFMILAAWPIRSAFQYYERRRQRQQAADRARALAIQAEIQDAAYIQGDDVRGVYGEFPPPPGVLGDNR